MREITDEAVEPVAVTLQNNVCVRVCVGVSVCCAARERQAG